MKIYQVALVVASTILGFFSVVIADAYSYLSLITSEVEHKSTSSVWSLVSVEFFILAIVLAIVFIVKSRKR